MKSTVECLNDFFALVVKRSKENFQINYNRLPNSIDFLSDGEAKKVPRAIVARVDARNRLEITFERNTSKQNQIRVEFLSEALDFTQPGCKPLKNTLFLDRYPSLNFRDEAELASKILKDFEDHRAGVLKTHRPSKQLSLIVGNYDLHRYQVLDRVTKYLHKNHLIYSNGDIKIDSTLKKMFGKNTVCVCENEFFNILRKNLKKVR